MSATGALAGRRIGVAFATLVGVAALAGVVAFWGWRWGVPPPAGPVRAPIADVVGALAVSPPFGTAPPSTSPAPSAPAAGDPRLLGVLAEPDGRGRALFRWPDGTARLASAGDALGGSGTLVSVHPDGVTLRDGGGERRIDLRAQAAAGPPRPGAAPASAGPLASCVPAGYKGPVVRLNAELVAGLIQQPQSLAAVAEARDGALVVRDEAGFAAMLGLQKGDRVTQANGIALRAPDDVVVAVLRPLAANQPVRMSGMRGNVPQELMIVNAGACR